MDKFWDWMTDNNYGTRYTVGINKAKIKELVDINGEQCVLPTKQMLIGYMLEYLNENDCKVYGLSDRLFKGGIDGVYRFLESMMTLVI